MTRILDWLELRPFEAIGLGAITGLFLLIYSWNLAVKTPRDYDEGVYLMTARMMADGFAGYAELFISQPPLLFLLAAPVMFLGGGLFAVRFIVVVFSMVGILGAGLVTNHLIKAASDEEIPPWAAIFPWAAAFLLGTSINWFIYGRILTPDVPQAALGITALWFLLRGRGRETRPLHDLFTGVFAGLAVMAKLFAGPPLLFYYGIHIWLHRDRRRFLWMTIGGAITALPIFLFDLPSFYVGAFGFQAGRGDHEFALFGNIGLLLSNTSIHGPGMVLGLPATAYCLWKKEYRILGLWTTLQVVVFMVYSPLFGHHLTILEPGFAVATGVLLHNSCLKGIHHWPESRRPAVWLSTHRARIAPGVLVLLLLLILPIGVLEGITQDVERPVAEEAAEIIEDLIGEDQYMITDAQAVAYLAQRRVPPQLVDTSSIRVRSGSVTAEEVIAAAEEFEVDLVFFGTHRLLRFEDWNSFVRVNYELRWELIDETWTPASGSPEIANGQIWVRAVI